MKKSPRTFHFYSIPINHPYRVAHFLLLLWEHLIFLVKRVLEKKSDLHIKTPKSPLNVRSLFVASAIPRKNICLYSIYWCFSREVILIYLDLLEEKKVKINFFNRLEELVFNCVGLNSNGLRKFLNLVSLKEYNLSKKKFNQLFFRIIHYKVK